MKRQVLAVTVAFAWSSAAWAEDSEFSVQMALHSFAQELTRAKPELEKGFTYVWNADPHECRDLVEKARALGMKTVKSFAFKPWGGEELTLDGVAKMCAEGDRWYNTFSKHGATFKKIQDFKSLLESTNDPESFQDDTAKNLELCKSAVAALLANFPPTAPFAQMPGDTPVPMSQLEAKYCTPLQQTSDAVIAKKKKAREDALARYAKAGITGEKADFMMENGANAYLAGGSAPDDLKKYAAAKLLFTWSTSDPDGDDFVVHRVTRYEFKGNKLVGNSTKTYRKKRGASVGSVFK